MQWTHLSGGRLDGVDTGSLANSFNRQSTGHNAAVESHIQTLEQLILQRTTGIFWKPAGFNGRPRPRSSGDDYSMVVQGIGSHRRPRTAAARMMRGAVGRDVLQMEIGTKGVNVSSMAAAQILRAQHTRDHGRASGKFELIVDLRLCDGTVNRVSSV
ncbi:hypothetical protein [Paraburkholderia caribensis]|uniref:hypothetical protein n=1 Tax=Paraburkholderia caribensis TaxID=75105 RepID=UPI001590C9A1|nr:hypothetical protein [Paraburkholderia caribensis]